MAPTPLAGNEIARLLEVSAVNPASASPFLTLMISTEPDWIITYSDGTVAARRRAQNTD